MKRALMFVLKLIAAVVVAAIVFYLTYVQWAAYHNAAFGGW